MHTPEKPSFVPGPYAVHLCQEPGIFNQSYFVTALRPNGFRNEEIIICRLPTGAGLYSQQLANARLLAAAPDLLQACMLLADNFGAVEQPGIVAFARSAIAKAKEGI